MHEPYLAFRFSVLSPYNFENGNANVFNGNDNGELNNDNVNNKNGARPAVSLKPGAYVSTGEGTAAKPYIIQ